MARLVGQSWVLRALGALLVLAGVQFTAATTALADTVTIKASEQQGYGRLTFRWPQPVGHQATRNGDLLLVTFSRPIQADLRPALRGLGAYVASIEPAPNEATVAFRIKGEFTVRSFDSGTSVVVDIVGAAAQPQAQAQPQGQDPAQAQVAGGPAVAVRVGAHPTYSRVVFDWPTQAGFALTRSGNTATLTFDKAATIDLAGLSGGRVKNISGATADAVDGKLALTFNIAANSRINAFAAGAKVVMDVYAPDATKAPPAATAAAVPQAAPQTADAQPQPDTPIPTQTTAPAAAESVPTPLTPPTPLEPALQADAAPTPLQPQPPTSGAPVRSTEVKTETLTDGIVSLRFEWNEPVGAAVFRRGEALWVVFDKRSKMDTAALARGGAGLVKSVEQVPSNDGTTLRLVTAEGINPSIKRSGYAWIMDFSKQPLFPSAPLQADSQPNSPLGARLFVAVPEPGNVIAFRDPEIGDNLVVVPVIPLGHGLSRPWTYPQLQFLPSKQGVVMRPLSDDLSVRPLRQGVEVTSTGTLQISDVSEEQRANIDLEAAMSASSGMGPQGPLSRVLDLEKWKRPDLQNITEIRQALQLVAAMAKGAKAKEKANREIATFFFANGFEAEALGVLAVMLSDRPEIENEPEFRMMRGAASWMMGRIEDARADVYDASLDGNDEATFWRAAVVVGEGKMPDVAYELRQVGAITQPYPKALKMPTALLVAEAAVELGDVKQATQYLEVLSIDNPTSAQRDQINYVSGLLKQLSGDSDGAIADWERVMEGVHRPSRAKASVARTELLLRQELFTPADAIEEFEKLRFVWRGDDFEFALLRRLGDLYLGEEKYREGLNALRQAVTNFPDNTASNQITKSMSDAFQFLYMQSGADILAPVTAIALYDEFRELTPAGAAGDEMIRKLADRLVGVDLLDRAADLLEAQVDFRLTGEEKGRVGARLALIYLFDRKYQMAIDSLDKTQAVTMNDALTVERVLLRAQAYVGLDQPDVSLDLLRPETGLIAEQIRSGIYWRAGNWKDASKSLAAVVRKLGVKAHKPLTDKQATSVLSLAISNTLEGNEAAVSRATVNYGPAMAQTPYADAFKLITAPPEMGLVDFRGLDPIVKKVEDFQGFMEVYRQRVAKGQLSSLY